jgi:sulfatase modifying factor 1
MRSVLLVVATVLINAGAAASVPVAGSASSESSKRSVARPRLAVLEFRVDGEIDETGGKLFAAAVREEFNNSARYDIMDRAMMVERFAELDFATVECDEVKCLVRYGKSLDVQKIVGGYAASFGGGYMLTMRLVDVNTGREERTFARSHTGDMFGLLDLARDGALYLLGEEVPKPTKPATPVRRSKPNAKEHTKEITLDLGNGVTMELVLIPAGEFMMGSGISAAETARRYGGIKEYFTDEHPQHEVRITRPFYMGKYEVTVAQFRRFVAQTGYVTEAERGSPGLEGGKPGGWGFKDGDWQFVEGLSWRKPGYAQEDSHPVVLVSWNDAQAFCTWLQGKSRYPIRLPTEAEWEYACRAGTSTAYSFGDDGADLHKHGNYCDMSNTSGYPWQDKTHDDGYDKTAAVGSFAPNAWGLYDMHGNVWEWCQDWKGDYPSSAQVDPTGPASGSARVLRGGSWYLVDYVCRSAYRNWISPGIRNGHYGFRICSGT